MARVKPRPLLAKPGRRVVYTSGHYDGRPGELLYLLDSTGESEVWAVRVQGETQPVASLLTHLSMQHLK